MSYLYEITMNLYNQLYVYYQKNPKEFFSLSNKKELDREVDLICLRVSNGVEKYYSTSNYPFAKQFFDLDFMADMLLSGVNSGRFFNTKKTHDKDKFDKFFDEKERVFFEDVKKAHYARRMINHFILRMRTYYLEDFMCDHDDFKMILRLREVFNRLVYVKFNINCRLVRDGSFEEITSGIKEKENDFFDLISELIDSNEFKESVIKQQQFYIKELTRLKEQIVLKGNITNINDRIFGLYLQFIDDFINKAQEKCNLLENPKIKTKIPASNIMVAY